MAISDSYLKSYLGRERDKVEEKADRDGLWVRISKKGAVTFFYRFRFLGKQDKMTIGSYPEFGLKAAREEVTKWAAILARGENPRIRQSLDKAKINSQYTFEELFREWHAMVNTTLMVIWKVTSSCAVTKMETVTSRHLGSPLRRRQRRRGTLAPPCFRVAIREWSGLNYLAEFVFSCGISLWEVHNKTDRKTPA